MFIGHLVKSFFLEDGVLQSGGRVDLTAERLAAFGRGLSSTDEVVLEATGNTAAIVRALKPFVAQVVIANPLQVRAIAHARVKADKIDAGILAQLHASGFLPTVWMPDPTTEALRRQISRRTQLVRHRTRLRNEIHSVLHAHLIPQCPHADLFGRKGRAWLAQQSLPQDELCAIEQRLREVDRHAEDLAVIDRALAQATLDDPRLRRLLAIAGVNVVVAISLIAAIGEIGRFRSPQKLVSYFGLNPGVRQSGLSAARHGRITKIGRAHAQKGRVRLVAFGSASNPIRWSPTRDISRSSTRKSCTFVGASSSTLGTDVFGRGDTPAVLRRFFEIDKRHVVLAALQALSDVRAISRELLGRTGELFNRF